MSAKPKAAHRMHKIPFILWDCGVCFMVRTPLVFGIANCFDYTIGITIAHNGQTGNPQQKTGSGGAGRNGLSLAVSANRFLKKTGNSVKIMYSLK